MKKIFQWCWNNKDWIFSGIGVLFITSIVSVILRLPNSEADSNSGKSASGNKNSSIIHQKTNNHESFF